MFKNTHLINFQLDMSQSIDRGEWDDDYCSVPAFTDETQQFSQRNRARLINWGGVCVLVAGMRANRASSIRDSLLWLVDEILGLAWGVGVQ